MKTRNSIKESIWLGGNLIGYSLNKNETKKVLKAALENGINKIDTSSSYGNGLSEQILGSIIRQQRERWIVSTKLGINSDEIFDGKATKNKINLMIDKSLKNLKTNYIDYYLLHHFDKKTPIFETISALHSQIKNGKIKNFGFCNVNNTEIKIILKACNKINIFPKIIQIECNICNPNNFYKIKNFLHLNNIIPMFYGVLGRGNFVKKEIPNLNKNKKDRLSLNHKILLEYKKPAIVMLRSLLNIEAEKRKISISSLLVNYCKYLSEQAQIILGIRTVSQINELNCDFRNQSATNFDNFEKKIREIQGIKSYKCK